MGGFGFVQRLGRRLSANGPGLIVAVIALILALAGGAFAASGALTGKQKKEVTKIAKQYAGKTGANGAPGANGTNGANGKDGVNGTNGKDGKNGESVTISAATIAECSEGGTKFTNGTGSGKACNGEPGEPGEAGPKGEPWTPNNTLPSGAIETGSWAFSADESESPALVPISFPVQLAAFLNEEQVHFSTEANFEDFDEGGDGTEGCKGSYKNPAGTGSGTLKPNPPGQLCVYLNTDGVNGIKNATFEGIYFLTAQIAVDGGGEKGAGRPGATLAFKIDGGVGYGVGSWAVTGA